MYLTAVIDWYSRYVFAWELSNSMESLFCVDALEHALTQGKPGIFNTDQGSQFTSSAYADGHSLHRGVDTYFDYYNHERKHSALDKRTPAEVFMEGAVRT